MAMVGVVEASRLAGVSRATVHRWIASGKLSATTGRDGKARIDTAELQRAFGTVALPDPATVATGRRRHDTGRNADATAWMQREIARLEGEVARLRQELVAAHEERREAQRALMQRALPAPGLLDRIAALIRRE